MLAASTLAPPRKAMIESRPSLASVADIAVEIAAADHVEDDVYAATAGFLQHDRLEILVAIVDRPFRAERLAGAGTSQ